MAQGGTGLDDPVTIPHEGERPRSAAPVDLADELSEEVARGPVKQQVPDGGVPRQHLGSFVPGDALRVSQPVEHAALDVLCGYPRSGARCRATTPVIPRRLALSAPPSRGRRERSARRCGHEPPALNASEEPAENERVGAIWRARGWLSCSAALHCPVCTSEQLRGDDGLVATRHLACLAEIGAVAQDAQDGLGAPRCATDRACAFRADALRVQPGRDRGWGRGFGCQLEHMAHAGGLLGLRRSAK